MHHHASVPVSDDSHVVKDDDLRQTCVPASAFPITRSHALALFPSLDRSGGSLAERAFSRRMSEVQAETAARLDEMEANTAARLDALGELMQRVLLATGAPIQGPLGVGKGHQQAATGHASLKSQNVTSLHRRISLSAPPTFPPPPLPQNALTLPDNSELRQASVGPGLDVSAPIDAGMQDHSEDNDDSEDDRMDLSNPAASPIFALEHDTASNEAADKIPAMTRGSATTPERSRAPPGSQYEKCHEQNPTMKAERKGKRPQEKEDAKLPEASIAMLDIFGHAALKEKVGDNRETSTSTEIVISERPVPADLGMAAQKKREALRAALQSPVSQGREYTA